MVQAGLSCLWTQLGESDGHNASQLYPLVIKGHPHDYRLGEFTFNLGAHISSGNMSFYIEKLGFAGVYLFLLHRL